MFKFPLLLLALTALVGSIGCATQLASESRLASPPAVSAPADRVFPTIEAAVTDALETARHRAGPADRERFRFGTIRRVSGGFAWSAPIRSRDAIGAIRPNRVRLQLGRDDVAIYGIHPRSGRAELDQLNETVNRQERGVVDGQDSLHRPLYVLTPSRRIVRYPETPETLEIVRQDTPIAR